MKITKMHGIGNDYLYVDGFNEQVEDPAPLARKLSDRHFGIGGDGLIIIRPPAGRDADCRMEMYNSDGSRGRMCGNGIRCVAKYVHDRGRITGDVVRVETDAGLRILEIARGASGKVSRVTVDMGAPRLARGEIPARIGGSDDLPALDVPLEVEGIGRVLVSLVSMGNPHCVVRLEERQPFREPLEDLRLAEIGPRFENHPAFPERINTEFVEVGHPDEIDLRVWERGSGETLACGTGACAAVVAGVLGGWCAREATVHLRGGDLEVRWDAAGETVFMTGPAVEVFTAEVNPDWLASGNRAGAS